MRQSPPVEELLQRTDLCADLGAKTLDGLARRANRLHAPTGRFIVDAGARDQPCHLIIEGSVQLAVPNVAGIEKTIATLEAGKVFGLAEFFSGLGYRYYARAQEPTLCVTIPGPTLQERAAQDPTLLQNLLVALGRHFDALVHDIEYSNRFTAHQRVVNLLLTSARLEPEGIAVTRLAHKKSVTASRLGLAPETFSRCLAQLSEAGLISVDRRTITIHDIAGMQSILAGAD